jgi:putative sterol carrier protein
MPAIYQDERVQRLLALVDTTPHDGLEAAVAAEPGGLDAAFQAIFELLVSEFNPAKAKGKGGVFQFEITGENPREFYVRVEAETCTFGQGSRDDADVTIGIKVPDMLLMGMGKLPGAKAFLTGKLKLRGNPLFGTKLGEWFDHP